MKSNSSQLAIGRVVLFREAADRFATTNKEDERDAALMMVARVWTDLRDRADEVGRLSPNLPSVEHVTKTLALSLRGGDPKEIRAAIDSLTNIFTHVDRAIASTGTPAAPAARWQPDVVVLSKEEKDQRLGQAAANTRRSARSMADALRKVISARRKQGVPLYSTFSNERRALYSNAVSDFSMGLLAPQPLFPAVTKRTAPWGTFKVRSAVAPDQAGAHFETSPPLPPRTELLASRTERVRFMELHRPQGRPLPADVEEDNDGIR